jgi:hypothetical protein
VSTLIESEFLVGEEAHALCYGAAMAGVGGEGIDVGEVERLREWAINVRHEAMLLDSVLAGEQLVRWPSGARGPVLYAPPTP